MTNWFTSDLHLRHTHVAELRGFDDVHDHDGAIAGAWDSQVKKDDVVWVLGDIALNDHRFALDFLKMLPGRKRLIAGNHDPVHPMHRRGFSKWIADFHEVFEFVQPFVRHKFAGINFLMQHFPNMNVGDGDLRGPARFEQFRLPDLGMPLLHGHTHSSEVFEGPNQFHVGWDAHRKLVSEQEVVEWLKSL